MLPYLKSEGNNYIFLHGYWEDYMRHLQKLLWKVSVLKMFDFIYFKIDCYLLQNKTKKVREQLFGVLDFY